MNEGEKGVQSLRVGKAFGEGREGEQATGGAELQGGPSGRGGRASTPAPAANWLSTSLPLEVGQH